MLVIVKVVLENQQQDNTDGNAKRQTKDIQERKEFILQEYADKEFQMCTEHGSWVRSFGIDEKDLWLVSRTMPF